MVNFAHCGSVEACIYVLHLHVYIRCHDRRLYLYCSLCLAVVSLLGNCTVQYSGCIHGSTQRFTCSWMYSECSHWLWFYAFCVIVVLVLCFECCVSVFLFVINQVLFYVFFKHIAWLIDCACHRDTLVCMSMGGCLLHRCSLGSDRTVCIVLQFALWRLTIPGLYWMESNCRVIWISGVLLRWERLAMSIAFRKLRSMCTECKASGIGRRILLSI